MKYYQKKSVSLSFFSLIYYFFLLLSPFVYFLTNDLILTLLIFLIFLSFLIYSHIYSSRFNYLNHIFIFYSVLVGPINIFFTYYSPNILITSNFNEAFNSNIFLSKNLIYLYLFLLLLFFLILIPFISIKINFNKFVNSILNFPKIINLRINFLYLIFLALIEYFLRIKFNLNVPGKLPLIVGSGYIVYFLDSIKYYFFFIILYKSILKRRNILFVFGNILTSLIIFQLPTVLIGQRGPILHSFFSILLFFIFLLSTKNFAKYFKALDLKINKVIFPIFFSISIIFIILGITNSIRSNEFEIFSFIVRRITGIFDGLIFLDNYSYNPFFPKNTFIDFFYKLFFEYGFSPNKYYTIKVLGYPETAVHGSATPIFVNSLYYGGFIGLISMTVYFGLLLGLINNILKAFLLKLEKQPSLQIIGGIYFCLLLFVMIFHSNIIDGDVTHWKFYSIPLISFFLVLFTKETKNF